MNPGTDSQPADIPPGQHRSFSCFPVSCPGLSAVLHLMAQVPPPCETPLLLRECLRTQLDIGPHFMSGFETREHPFEFA